MAVWGESAPARAPTTGFSVWLASIQVRVVRHAGSACQALRDGRFVPMPCDQASRTFTIGWTSGRTWMLPLPALKPGTYTVLARAVDNGGNTADASRTLHLHALPSRG